MLSKRNTAAAVLAIVVTSALLAAERVGKPGDTVAPLWVEPKDLEKRDLFYGAGGKKNVPPPDATYRYEKSDTTGHSRGYYVYGRGGEKWRVKVGSEAQSEVAVSRLLWAIGYHQPALYYVPRWKMAGHKTEHPEPGRFRLISDHTTEGDWSYRDNPFNGSRELHGLIVANLLLNNWDVAPSNNRIYRVKTASGGHELRYVAQDVGGSLGKTRLPVGSRNKIDDFESQEFILGMEDGRIDFDYHGRHHGIVKKVTPDDVEWVCRLFARLSDAQYADAFRAAGYTDDVARRYIRKIRAKIDQGLALKSGPSGMR